ncbi:MAG: glycosyltransferase [Elusimicrobiota bacterium]|nr:MAG: glycosyltransferase [Elusimicrobiota bacterium]
MPGLEILVVDDESPDGTAGLVEELGRARPALRLLRRPPPAGRGLAGRDGYLKALDLGASFVIEMDADFSHRPRHIPQLLAAMDGADLVLGSRLAPGGRDLERTFLRHALTALGGAWARALLGLPVADVNSGFRCFSRAALEAVSPATLASEGPAIVHETLYRAARAGLRVREIPIDFAERRAGESKLGVRQLLAGWLAILRLRLS